MTLLVDAGAFVALERGDRATWRRFKAELASGQPPITHGGIVAEVWRGGHGRQALLARALAGARVVPLDESLGRAAGVLLARAGTADALDAALVALASDDDCILTSDGVDIQRLVNAAGRHVDVIPA